MARVLALVLAGAGRLWADPLISEFMAANTATLADEDGAYPDWIELHNPDSTPVNLNGWYLTDSATNKLKWQFPAVTIPAGGYLVVFASDKNRRDPAAHLHTNFALDADGEYLALVRPDGTSVASEFAPKFPRQQLNVSYGLTGSQATGTPVYLTRATPGAANSEARPIGIAETVAFSHAAGPFSAPFSLTLSGAGAGQQIRYVVAPASSGARTAEPTATSPLYSAPIAINSATVVRAALFSTDGRTRGATRTVYYSKISAGLAGFASALPVIVIDSLGSGNLVKDGIDHSTWLYSYAPRSGGAPVFSGPPDLVSPSTASVRGSSSAEFPKKGYNLQFTDELGNDSAPAWLDLGTQRKWVLVAPWKFDLNYINNPLTYALAGRLGRWSPRTRIVELYFNANGNDIDSADYAGIYVIADRIEVGKKRVDLANLNPSEVSGDDLTGGYILKIDAKDPDEIGWVTNRGLPKVPNLDAAVVLVSPSATEIAPAQLAYIRAYVQRMEDALVASRDSGWARRTYLDYIDRATWVDHHLLNTLVANPDGLQRSAYFTKDRKGRLVAGPEWDFDRALGSHWDERSFQRNVWFGIGSADVWETSWWGILARDPEFIQEWIDRWYSLRRTELANGSLLALIDSLTSNLGAAAARDVARWPDNASLADPTRSYADQVAFLKAWLTQRAEWIDTQFLAPPAAVATGTTLTFTSPPGTELAYTLDGSDPRSLGGGVAPNAILSSSPVTVPLAANIHARSYKPSLLGVYPGSPWSAPAGGSSSSTLSPPSRLVNISSRAIVGTGENALIAGVVVADTGAKRYLSRAIGPALGVFGVTDFVPDPQLSIYRGATELFRNNGWETGPDASKLPSYSKSVGAFALPERSRDSALANELGADAYTIQITTPSATPGVGLAELYELDALGRTVNLSTRAQVRTGSGVLIGGFVVSGGAYKRMLIRAVGPTLGSFGVSGALRDPILTVYDSKQAVVATNDRWESAANVTAVRAAAKSVGAFDLIAAGEDAALLITLRPDAYTVEVKGKDSSEGVALLEIYEVP